MFSVNGVSYEFFWQADAAQQALINAGQKADILKNGVAMSSAEVSMACFYEED